MASQSSSSAAPAQPNVTLLCTQAATLIRTLRATLLVINETVNNATSMKALDNHQLKRMFVRINDIYGKLESIAHQIPAKSEESKSLEMLSTVYNAEQQDLNIYGANPPPKIAQQKTQVDDYLSSQRYLEWNNQYLYYAEQLYKLGGTVPAGAASSSFVQKRRLFLDRPPLTFTEVTPENNPHSLFLAAFHQLKEEAQKKKYGIWMEILEKTGQGSILEIKTGHLVEKQSVVTQKTMVVENNGNVDLMIFLAPHEEWKYVDEAGEYGRKLDVTQRSRYQVYQKLTTVANTSLTHLLVHGPERNPSQVMTGAFHLLTRYNKVFETKCKVCGNVMKNYLPCVFFDPRNPSQSLHEGCR